MGWRPALLEAVGAGLDIVSGMHTRLACVAGLAEAAQRRACRLLDVRHSDRTFAGASGVRRPRPRGVARGPGLGPGGEKTPLGPAPAARTRRLPPPLPAPRRSRLH